VSRSIVLDAGPLGLVTNPKSTPLSIACREWVIKRVAAGDQIFVPEIADFEVRRELIRAGKTSGIRRLDTFNAQVPSRYLPLDTSAMRLAAELWAQARTRGTPTADPKELDADAILAAQAQGVQGAGVIVATTNVGHLSQFITADIWQNI